jgi:hypothetical protein
MAADVAGNVDAEAVAGGGDVEGLPGCGSGEGAVACGVRGRCAAVRELRAVTPPGCPLFAAVAVGCSHPLGSADWACAARAGGWRADRRVACFL